MRPLLFCKETAVWLLLAALTGLTWNVGSAAAGEAGAAHAYAVLALLLVAFFKVRLVIMHFMEIGDAPLPLRLVFEVWVVAVCAAMIATFYTL